LGSLIEKNRRFPRKKWEGAFIFYNKNYLKRQLETHEYSCPAPLLNFFIQSHQNKL